MYRLPLGHNMPYACTISSTVRDTAQKAGLLCNAPCMMTCTSAMFPLAPQSIGAMIACGPGSTVTIIYCWHNTCIGCRWVPDGACLRASTDCKVVHVPFMHVAVHIPIVVQMVRKRNVTLGWNLRVYPVRHAGLGQVSRRAAPVTRNVPLALRSRKALASLARDARCARV